MFTIMIVTETCGLSYYRTAWIKTKGRWRYLAQRANCNRFIGPTIFRRNYLKNSNVNHDHAIQSRAIFLMFRGFL